MIPAKPGITFLCGRKGPTGRIAARIMSSEVRENGAGPVRTGTHAGHTDIEMALRSKPEGDFLLLTRLVRCRRASGPTADDAVLTLKILIPIAQNCWATVPNPAGFAKASASRGTGGGFS